MAASSCVARRANELAGPNVVCLLTARLRGACHLRHQREREALASSRVFTHARRREALVRIEALDVEAAVAEH